MQLEALAATGVATILIKVSVDRTRPDASDRASFPSGHTSTTFATATVLNEIYGWRAGAPAFALAALTGLSRMSADRHWFSDVAAGATLGVWLGRAFATDANQASASAPAARNSRSLVWFEPRVEGGSAQALWDF
jgi:membrane-associated phospholipid phosphatase